MKNKLIWMFNLLMFFSMSSFSQVIKSKSFVIITFERIQKGKATENYFWTVPADSVKKLIFKVKPLYVDTASQYNIDKCKNGESIDFFYSFEGTSKSYTEEIRSFINLNSKQKIKLQEISVKWNSEKTRVDEIVRVFATAITGSYCTCQQIYRIGSAKEPVFSTQIYLPISNFSIDSSFWNSQAGKIIKYADYSTIDFTRYMPYIYQDRARSRAIINEN